MKTFFTILVLVTTIQIAFACTGNITQNNWRWRNNDGNETSATWKADQKTGIVYNTNQGIIRLRVEVVNKAKKDNGLAITNACVNIFVTPTDSLQYTTNTAVAGSWKNIGTDSRKAFVLAGTNGFVNQNDVTTSQINGDGSSFSPGKIMMTDSVAKGFYIQSLGRTEVEWAIVGTDSMQLNTVYYFRHRGIFTDSVSYSRTYTYNTYPSLTTTAPLPIKLTRFTVKSEGGKARLEWATATEQNNDRFEVQRSPDQHIWQTIATVKGKGNSTTPVFYTAYDDNPLPGSSYYRLQQFDKDGKSVFSEIRFLRKGGSAGNQFVVFPNPVQGAIWFTNTGSTAENITATVSDVSGKILYRQQLGQVQAGSTNTLGMATPPPGFYFLRLTNGTTTETLKLIIK